MKKNGTKQFKKNMLPSVQIYNKARAALLHIGQMGISPHDGTSSENNYDML